MKPQMKSSPAARELIKRFEPFRPVAEPGPDGRMLVGYGHRAAAKPGVKVSEDEAALLLIYDVMQSEKAIDEVASEPLSRRQRDALVAFVHGVGVAAFKTSDVARYLYEGRAQAAGEAIAAFGDGQGERREAESAHFLAGEPAAPAAPRKKAAPPTVELLIKIEHPEDEAEGAELAAAEMAASHPDEEPAVEIAPPLVPPPTVEAPAETPADDALAGEAVGVESVELPPAPLPPEPLAAVADGALPEPEAEAEPQDAQPEEPAVEAEIDAPAAEQPEEEPAPAPQPAKARLRSAAFGAGFSGGPLPFSPAIRIADPKDAAALKDKADSPAAEAAPAADETTTEVVAEPEEPAVETPEPETPEAEAPEAEALQAEAPVVETLVEEAPEDAAPEIEAQDEEDIAADEAVDMPVEDVAGPEPELAAPAEDPAAQVIARMERQIDGMQAEIEGVDRGYARAESGEDETRIEGRVGYVFAGEMHARLPGEEDSQTVSAPEIEVEIADESEAEAEALAADEAEDDAPTPEAEAEAEPVVEPEETDAEDEPSAEAPAAEDEPVQLDPVLIAPADAEPPHPAEAPAFANGAVGEAGSGQVFEIEDAEDEPFADQRDELAPEDLGGDIDPYSSEDLKTEQGDELIGFSIAFGIGLIVVAFGGLETWSRLDYYMSEGSIFPGPGAIAGGLFLTIGAGYFTVTELLHKLRRR